MWEHRINFIVKRVNNFLHRDIAKEESEYAAKEMGEIIEDLGVCPLPDASPNTRFAVFSIRPKKNMCVYCHMLKKIRAGRSGIFFFYILFFITELMLDGI